MESTNIGIYSTLVEQGSGEAIVIATGDHTVFGKMSAVTHGKSNTEITSLRREINRFVLGISLVTLFGISILWITWEHGRNLIIQLILLSLIIVLIQSV